MREKGSKTLRLVGLLLLALTGLQNSNLAGTVLSGRDTIPPTAVFFTETATDFRGKEKNLRKWDAPVVADLDGDGYPDLLLNDHGFGLRVRWNNGGRFAAPYDLVMGDLHGITVGDYDNDGHQEIFVSRGGGSGSNARTAKAYRVTPDRKITPLTNVATELAPMRGRTLRLADTDQDGLPDLLNFAFPDHLRRGRSENYRYHNAGNGRLELQDTLPAVRGDGQKTALTDFDNDGVPDVIWYGNGSLRAFRGGKNAGYTEVSQSVLPPGLTQVTACTELDFDQDGDWDLVLSRGEDFPRGASFYDPESRIWGFYVKRGPFSFPDLDIGDVLTIENFQSQWPHKDIFLGESPYPYAFPGETHSGRDLRLVNSDALGFPDALDEKGGYLGYVGNGRWRFAGNLWAPATGIFHGVRSNPVPAEKTATINAAPRDLLLENRNGKFIISEQHRELFPAEHSAGLLVGDFDNNGWLDVVVIPRGNLVSPIKARVYLNHRGTFRKVDHHDVVTHDLGSIGLGGNALDYNLDGQLDLLLGHERGKWHLFKNTAPPAAAGRSLLVTVGDAPSGRATALGATVTVAGCSLRQQQRVGNTAAAYSGDGVFPLHFGLGECSEKVRVTVHWTNGEEETKEVLSGKPNTQLGRSRKRIER